VRVLDQQPFAARHDISGEHPWLEFVVPGPAFGKQAMIPTRDGMKLPKETREYMRLVADLARRVAPPEPWHVATLEIVASWEPGVRPYTDVPRSAIGSTSGEWYCDSKPDWDNIGKAIGDALKGVVLVDDCKITKGSVEKVFGERSETRVVVRRVGKQPTQIALIDMGRKVRRKHNVPPWMRRG
jgi:Holliday junction resolvase RusA-like endonuclease